MFGPAHFNVIRIRRNTAESKPTDAPIKPVYFFAHNMNAIFIWVYNYFMYVICIQ